VKFSDYGNIELTLEWTGDDENFPEGYWIVKVPTMPGCISDGKDVLHALVMIHDAMVVWNEATNEDR